MAIRFAIASLPFPHSGAKDQIERKDQIAIERIEAGRLP
jgi:predicted class III extradiol MEMO1 family dioxygenase